jgi:hypothetical protein
MQDPALAQHFYSFGDIYQTIEACDELETLLGRLKRQHLLEEPQWAANRQHLADIRQTLEDRINSAALVPKASRLP